MEIGYTTKNGIIECGIILKIGEPKGGPSTNYCARCKEIFEPSMVQNGKQWSHVRRSRQSPTIRTQDHPSQLGSPILSSAPASTVINFGMNRLVDTESKDSR